MGSWEHGGRSGDIGDGDAQERGDGERKICIIVLGG